MGGHNWEYLIQAKLELPAAGYTILRVSSLDSCNTEEASYLSRDAFQRNGFATLVLCRVDTTKGCLHVGPITQEVEADWEETQLIVDNEFFAKWTTRGMVASHAVERIEYYYKRDSRLQIQVSIDWKGDDGFLTLRMPCETDAALYGDHPFGVEGKRIHDESYSPASHAQDGMDIGGWDSNMERQRTGLFFASSFVQTSCADTSFTYVNGDATHYYRRGPGYLENLLLNDVSEFRPGVNRFINQNMRPVGRHRFVSHLQFHSGDWKAIGSPALSQRCLSAPEIVRVTRASKGSLPSCDSFLRIEPANVLLSAFYIEDDDTVLRVYESADQNSKVLVVGNRKPTAVRKTNFLGEEIADTSIRIVGDEIRFALGACEIGTFRIRWQK